MYRARARLPGRAGQERRLRRDGERVRRVRPRRLSPARVRGRHARADLAVGLHARRHEGSREEEGWDAPLRGRRDREDAMTKESRAKRKPTQRQSEQPLEWDTPMYRLAVAQLDRTAEQMALDP